MSTWGIFWICLFCAIVLDNLFMYIRDVFIAKYLGKKKEEVKK